MILLDTNVLVAIVDQRDERRPRALNDLDRLWRKGLLLTWPVLTESLHFLRRPDQRDYLMDFVSEFGIRFAEEDHLPDYHAVFAWLHQYGDHQPDLVDAYLVVLTTINRRWKVWSYDREFQQIWRRPDGSAVPMALK